MSATVAPHFGVYPALVSDLVDPDGVGRVEVELPWLGEAGDSVRVWARLVSPYADDDQGLQVLPEVGSEVVVAFEAGDLRRAYVLGAAWNGREALPVAASAANDIRILRTRSGSVLEFDDATGRERITLSLATGHKVVLDAGGMEIRVEHSAGGSVVLTPTAIQVTANATVDVRAAMVNVQAPMSKFSGVVQCDTLICSTGVVSPSYTPGAGNVW